MTRPTAADLQRLVDGAHHDPHAVLGIHADGPDGSVVRARLLGARGAEVRWDGGAAGMHRVHDEGDIWAGRIPAPPGTPYRLAVDWDGHAVTVEDPYRFAPTVGELDLHLLGEGRHERLWEALGAHVATVEGVAGTRMAVWAPNARAVRVVGDWNGWDGRAHPMRSLGSSGVWELFLPGVGAGARYKFQIVAADGAVLEKADPLAREAEAPPRTASVVAGPSGFRWGDEAWLEGRRATNRFDGPMSVYELHVGSWREGLGFRELADVLPAYLADLGFTHVELMPVMEHPFGGSWGYQVTGYFAPTARWGTPDDLRLLVDALHRAGIGVILDWVPAHFPRDAHGLYRFDGTALYEHADPRLGEHPDWDTAIFNFARTEVRNFLVANALYWLQEFHVDGLRVDAVASMLYRDYSRPAGAWLPNVHGGRENLEAIDLLRDLNSTVYRVVPDAVTIAEESTDWDGVTRPVDHGGLGFGLKWNMGWMHDTLGYLEHDPVHRAYHHDQITFSIVYAWAEHYVLPLSHDEVVHGKGSIYEKLAGDRWQKLAGLRALLAYQWSHPGKQLIFMGTEIAQGYEWRHERSIDWNALLDPVHEGVQRLVRDLNAGYRRSPALWALDGEPRGFAWIDAGNREENLLLFERHGPDGELLVVCANLSPVPREVRVGLARPGRWLEVLNTDAAAYGGSGVGNEGAVEAEARPWHGREWSADVRVPPLAVVWLAPA